MPGAAARWRSCMLPAFHGREQVAAKPILRSRAALIRSRLVNATIVSRRESWQTSGHVQRPSHLDARCDERLVVGGAGARRAYRLRPHQAPCTQGMSRCWRRRASGGIASRCPSSSIRRSSGRRKIWLAIRDLIGGGIDSIGGLGCRVCRRNSRLGRRGQFCIRTGTAFFDEACVHRHTHYDEMQESSQL